MGTSAAPVITGFIWDIGGTWIAFLFAMLWAAILVATIMAAVAKKISTVA